MLTEGTVLSVGVSVVSHVLRLHQQNAPPKCLRARNDPFNISKCKEDIKIQNIRRREEGGGRLWAGEGGVKELDLGRRGWLREEGGGACEDGSRGWGRGWGWRRGWGVEAGVARGGGGGGGDGSRGWLAGLGLEAGVVRGPGLKWVVGGGGKEEKRWVSEEGKEEIRQKGSVNSPIEDDLLILQDKHMSQHVSNRELDRVLFVCEESIGVAPLINELENVKGFTICLAWLKDQFSTPNVTQQDAIYWQRQAEAFILRYVGSMLLCHRSSSIHWRFPSVVDMLWTCERFLKTRLGLLPPIPANALIGVRWTCTVQGYAVEHTLKLLEKAKYGRSGLNMVVLATVTFEYDYSGMSMGVLKEKQVSSSITFEYDRIRFGLNKIGCSQQSLFTCLPKILCYLGVKKSLQEKVQFATVMETILRR
ncbi:hypothetical protein Fmac_025282 [Flemingia macrophylla]|uniref:Uncharacterized protein n=1 Tax=Flemingia macrophylla TaxID=520843 RepID=A0ABD1LRU3_9FABA